RCSPFCGGDACAPGCADECSPILCAGNYCNPERCPNTLGRCDILCGGDPCGPECPDECSPILCPANALCHTQCGGNPCNVGCICEPDCPTTRCSPFCPGGDACASGCADECSSVLCSGNYCNPLRCPSTQTRCDLLCGGNPCNFGCPDECSQVLCPQNSCNERCHPECNLLCGGSPCNPGCGDECSLVLCPQNHCGPQCNAAPQCDLLCGGDVCGAGCPDECSPVLCPTNVLCEPRCGADPCSFGCICEPDCWQTQWNPLCGGSARCDIGLPFAASDSSAPLAPIEFPADANAERAKVSSLRDRENATQRTEAVWEIAASGLWGFADLHNHQFANLAFGGLFLAGKPFEPSMSPRDGIGYALHCCGDNPEIPCGAIECVSNPFNNHGTCGCGDIVGATMGEFLCHNVGGYPQFEGWPRWYSYTHQQVYFEWLQRAWEGGLRLMTMIAVNSEVLCQQVNGIYSCDDMEAVDRQIKAAKDLEEYIDFWDDGRGNNSGWYRIAYSAEQARQIIGEGKLAVVLGIEVAGLFGCRENEAERCTPTHIEEQLQHYYAMGVRQITPIHVINNAFGGAALYNEFFNAANNIINKQYFEVYDCSGDGYEFRFQGSPLLALVAGYFPPEYPPAPAAHCNKKRLTDEIGARLIEQMIAKGMIIDVDHMSARTKDDVLRIAEGRCYPVISSHCGFNAISRGQKNHEGQESPAQVARIRALGGLIAPITHQGDACETGGEHAEGCIRQYGDVRNDCDNSSRSWAQAYSYAVDEAHGGAVAMGTDFNGGAGQPSPRYGPEACNREGGEQREGEQMQYPFELHGLPGTMAPSITGGRTFNINCDGLAHVGMLPDFIADLKIVGVKADDLNPLFRSAEHYVAMWERIEAQADTRTDLHDFKQMFGCLNGPGGLFSVCACSRFDADSDGDVDLADFAAFETTLSPAP
ncbi:MAG: membrane dipeptidase, partial [Phycisphaerales bacterium]|nr:membrane dipeptidase [Phycisphaerales bacterium]